MSTKKEEIWTILKEFWKERIGNLRKPMTKNEKIVMIFLGVLSIIILIFAIQIHGVKELNSEKARELCNQRMEKQGFVLGTWEGRGFLNQEIPKGYSQLMCEYVINETIHRKVYYVRTE